MKNYCAVLQGGSGSHGGNVYDAFTARSNVNANNSKTTEDVSAPRPKVKNTKLKQLLAVLKTNK